MTDASPQRTIRSNADDRVGFNRLFPLFATTWFVAILFVAVWPRKVSPQQASTNAPRDSEWTLPSDSTIRALLAERMAHNGVGIVVGVIDSNGRRVVSYGRSDASNRRPLDGNTVFQIGSVTKPFTSLLLADMARRGEVSLDDPAAKYLPPGVRMPQRGRPITLRDLAEHVSGLPPMPTNFDLNGDPNPYEAYTVNDLHAFLSSYTPEREPGEEEVYSNLGVALLGSLLANRMETDYETLLKERVLGPLGMESTSITLNSDQQKRLAPGHDRYLYPVYTPEMEVLPASGSLRSTANDMLALLAAYLGYRNTTLDSTMTLQLDETLGWGKTPSGRFGHSGGKAGYRAAVTFNPNTGIGAVVLANARTNDEPMNIARYLVAGEPLEPAPHAPSRARATPPHAVLDRYAGRYLHHSGEELEVARNGHRLVVRYPSGAIFEFVAAGQREFFYHGGNDDILFDVDSQGRVTDLKLYGDGKTFESRGKLYQRVGNL